MQGYLDRIKTCSMLPLWVLLQTKRLMQNGNSLKESNAILKIGRSTKGKESGIIYEYDCIKSFVETASFNKFSAKFGLDSQLLVDFLKSFASHLNMPKENWIKHHEPFKEICKENEIVNDDCNMHDPIPENEVLYKHVNFCGVDRPCERPMIEEGKYCKQHKHERTITWVRDLNEIARELCDLYPCTCELCCIKG